MRKSQNSLNRKNDNSDQILTSSKIFLRELSKKLVNALLKIDWLFGLKETFLVYSSKFDISA